MEEEGRKEREIRGGEEGWVGGGETREGEINEVGETESYRYM